ncbi:uncharacterized protein LOC129736886 [Falco cherrug]|uniref:uncharacterized protein LOC129736886 n=1 Tax=Falco cherrug TaxID=345164 RepID=UPI002479B46C|nr:uncharacterized protein LOC129736886 [Falco cherrug]
MRGFGERCPVGSSRDEKGLPGGREGRDGYSSLGRLDTSAYPCFGHLAVASSSWQGAGRHWLWRALSSTEPPELGQGCCSVVPAHPVVPLGTGRARLGCSPCGCLSVPVIPSLVCKTLTSPPARAMQLERDNYKLLSPRCPWPGSWSLPVGQVTLQQGSAVLQGCTPGTEHGTELFWQRWRDGEHSKEEKERKAGFPAWLCLHFAASPSQPDPLRFTSDFCYPKALTFSETLGFGQHSRLPRASPLCSLPAGGSAFIFTQDEPRSGSAPADIQSLSFLQIPLRFCKKKPQVGLSICRALITRRQATPRTG